MTPDTVQSLIEELRDEAVSGERRAEAATRLGESGHPDAVPALLEALQVSFEDIELDDEDGLQIRWAAAEALGRLGRPEALPQMIGYLNDRSSDDEVARTVACRSERSEIRRRSSR